MQVTLTAIAGPHAGRVFTFDGHEAFIVGRSALAHFRLPIKDKYFSRLHFLVEINPPRCCLLDMGSTNGTFVNRRRAGSAELSDADEIRAGKTVLRVSIAGAEAPGETLAIAANAPTDWPGTLTSLGGLRWGSPPPVPIGMPGAKAPGRIGDYEILRELGRGSMGIVYLARRSGDGPLLALKTIAPAMTGSPVVVGRFLREASVVRELDHPKIVSFRDQGEVDGLLYFAMDFVEGLDAEQIRRSLGGTLPIGRAVGLIVQVLEGLAYAHARRFVHRDVKPSNVLVEDPGGREHARLADFGLARVYQASRLSGLTLPGNLGGTVAFLAPEQVLDFRETRPPADQYAAAASLYYLIAGRAVYDLPARIQLQIAMILQDRIIPIRSRRPDVPAELGAILDRALSREPSDRFADVSAFREALRAYRDG